MQSIRSMSSWFLVLLLVGATCAAYFPVTRAGFIWDDDYYVADNPVFTAQHPLQTIWCDPAATPQYYPLVFTTFYIERQMWGLNPAGYHVVNVLIHAASAVLLWRVLKRLRVPGALLAAGVFALHPIMVESVAWMTELKNTLSTLFVLLSLLVFLRFLMPADPLAAASGAGQANRRWWWYAGSLVFFILALLSKTVASGLAPVLVLIIWWKRCGKTTYAATIPYFVLGMAGGLFTAYLEKTHVGASGAAWDLSPAQKVLLAGRAVWFYLGKILYPANLSFYYPRWTIDAGVWWQWLYPAGVMGALAGLWLARGKIGRGAFVGGAAFVALLFPALGFFALFPMLFSWVADHFAYLATLALIPAVCAGLSIAARRLPAVKAGVWWALAAAALAALGCKTYLTSGNYTSYETLWRSVLAYDPDHPHWNALVGMSYVMHTRALELQKQGRPAEALDINEQARAFAETALAVRPGYAVAHYELALYHQVRGDTAQTLAEIAQAIELDPSDARFHAVQARAYESAHQNDKALAAAEKAVTLDPTKIPYYLEYAQLLMDMGQDDRARQALAIALLRDAHNANAHLLLGVLWAQNNRVADARREFEQAVRDDPANLEAQDSLARLVAILPDATPAQLGDALARAQNAVAASQRANPAYLDTLAMVWHRMGNDRQALAALTEALNVKVPIDATVRGNIQRHVAAYGPRDTAPATTR